MNHSPLPWEVDGPIDAAELDEECRKLILIKSGKWDVAYVAHHAVNGSIKNQEDEAKFVCLAVNHFEELVRILGLLLGRGASVGEPGYISFAEMVQTGEALLAKLEADK